MVTGSEGVLEEEVSGGRDGASCPGEGVVPVTEDRLRVAMADGGELGVHFSVTARTLWEETGRERSSEVAGETLSQAADSPDSLGPPSSLGTIQVPICH